MIERAPKNHNNTLIILTFSIFIVFWGTGWNVPYINISTTTLFLPLIFLVSIYYNIFKYSFEFRINSIILYFIFYIILIIYFYFGFIKNELTPESIADTNYLLDFTIKCCIFPMLLILIPNFILNKKHVIKFVKYSAIFFIPLYIYLHYRFIYQLGTPFVGVSIEGNGKIGKNAFGGAIALLYPFFLATYFTQVKKSKLIFTAILLIIISTIYIKSRSMIIVVVIESAVFFLFSHSSKIKRIGTYSLIIILVFLSFNYSENIKKTFMKNNYSGELGQYDIEDENNLSRDETMFLITGKYDYNYYFLDTHRGWLLYEGIQGFKKSHYLGNGLASFRIRSTNNNHKTDTHNDIILILYETGIIGLFALSVFFSYFIFKSYKLSKSKQDYFLDASLASSLGTLIFMIFTNIISSPLPWVIIALNVSIINYNQRN